MSKIAVVYRSKSGFTKKYAEWIAGAVGADLLRAEHTKIRGLLAYDTIVYGAALYAVGINGIKLITKNIDMLKNKKLIVFTLGATPVREQIINEVRNSNLSQEHQKHIRFFMLRGGFDFSKLTFGDKFLMLLLKAKLKRKKQLDPDERGMLESFSHPLDLTDERHIGPIVEAIKS